MTEWNKLDKEKAAELCAKSWPRWFLPKLEGERFGLRFCTAPDAHAVGFDKHGQILPRGDCCTGNYYICGSAWHEVSAKEAAEILQQCYELEQSENKELQEKNEQLESTIVRLSNQGAELMDKTVRLSEQAAERTVKTWPRWYHAPQEIRRCDSFDARAVAFKDNGEEWHKDEYSTSIGEHYCNSSQWTEIPAAEAEKIIADRKSVAARTMTYANAIAWCSAHSSKDDPVYFARCMATIMKHEEKPKC